MPSPVARGMTQSPFVSDCTLLPTEVTSKHASFPGVAEGWVVPSDVVNGGAVG